MKTFNEYKGKRKTTQGLTEKVDQILDKAKETVEITETFETASLPKLEEKLDTTSTAQPIKENATQTTRHYEEKVEKVEEALSGYVIYRDKSENFICDMQLSGVSSSENKARIILETQDLTYMFEGRIDTLGKCKIPLKKMNFLKENETGKIKLEVIAEDTVFTPWEDDFVAITSKKVSVRVVESEVATPKIEVKVTNIGNR
jgi:hypothetical protein